MKKLFSLLSCAQFSTIVVSATQEYYLIDRIVDLTELGAVRAPARVTTTTKRTYRPAPVVSRTTFVPTTYRSHYSPLVISPVIPFSFPAYHSSPVIQTT